MVSRRKGKIVIILVIVINTIIDDNRWRRSRLRRRRSNRTTTTRRPGSANGRHAADSRNEVGCSLIIVRAWCWTISMFGVDYRLWGRTTASNSNVEFIFLLVIVSAVIAIAHLDKANEALGSM
jgi:hypothetical protein